MIYERNQTAINEQIQAKVDHEVHWVLPFLHGLSNIFSDYLLIKPTEELEELSKVLSSIQIGLHGVIHRDSREQDSNLDGNLVSPNLGQKDINPQMTLLPALSHGTKWTFCPTLLPP